MLPWQQFEVLKKSLLSILASEMNEQVLISQPSNFCHVSSTNSILRLIARITSRVQALYVFSKGTKSKISFKKIGCYRCLKNLKI